jgi:hypothetical protein
VIYVDKRVGRLIIGPPLMPSSSLVRVGGVSLDRGEVEALIELLQEALK